MAADFAQLHRKVAHAWQRRLLPALNEGTDLLAVKSFVVAPLKVGHLGPDDDFLLCAAEHYESAPATACYVPGGRGMATKLIA